MNTLIILIGVRGAGKSSLIKQVSTCNNVQILTPSTTRAPRSADEDEYEFLSKWNIDNFAWSIDVQGKMYGLKNSEIEKVKTKLFSFTVFDPGSINELNKFRESYEGQVLTIGLDTIDCVETQKQRVDESSRKQEKSELEEQIKIVQNSDVVISGSLEQTYTATKAIIECLNSRGGVLPKPVIEKLFVGGSLLTNTEGKVSPASYDLRLGATYWCQGVFNKLDESNPFLKIPPYSYVIVSSMEVANLPSFVTARFDLKNSLFFQGVILSNGPQIDPGYRGALFCMLYNGNDDYVPLKFGAHFATIEFVTTAGLDMGYRDKYQGKTELQDFMKPSVAISKGGRIVERTENKIDKIQEEWKNFRGILFIFLGLIFSPSLLVYFNVYNIFESWNQQESEVKVRLDEIRVLEQNIKRELKALKQVKDELQVIKTQSKTVSIMNDTHGLQVLPNDDLSNTKKEKTEKSNLNKSSSLIEKVGK